MTVCAITETKKGRTGIAPTYLQTTSSLFHKIKLSIYLYSRIYTKMITPYYYKYCSIK